MARLNISKVAVGCASLEALQRRQRLRLRDGIVPITTRFRPKRAEELIGGSLYWIIKHRLTVRQTIIGFTEAEDRRTMISLDPQLIQVRAAAKRAHQGWRYLAAEDAPADLVGADDGILLLPPLMVQRLSALALI